jgi:tRNA (guanine37-N1)-methyltransferase
MADPLVRAIEDARKVTPGPVLMLAPRGDMFVQATAQRLSEGEGLVLVCGRYEGVDERVYSYVDGCLCMGEYVLSAGDPAAWCVIDAIARLRPGVLGNSTSLEGESFGERGRHGPPQYTRPMDFRGEKVPEVLCSGDHAAIAAWRNKGLV